MDYCMDKLERRRILLPQVVHISTEEEERESVPAIEALVTTLSIPDDKSLLVII